MHAHKDYKRALNCDALPGDILRRLEIAIARTPLHCCMVVEPLPRALLVAAVEEIKRLRAENTALMRKKEQQS